MDYALNRTELLLGADVVQRIGRTHIILFGVGGVGSWCAEALVRSGVCHLTIVDNDQVCPSNINRQLMATTRTIGRPKVEALRERLLEINPEACITAFCQVYDEKTADSFNLSNYDYVIDAIDSLQEKAHLILHTTHLSVRLFSAMGAALKMDPTRIRVAEFWQAKGCPLARALRQRFKRMHSFPAHKFLVVFSDELLTNQQPSDCADTDAWSNRRARTNGSLCHEVGIFGFTLAGLVIQDIVHLMHN